MSSENFPQHTKRYGASIFSVNMVPYGLRHAKICPWAYVDSEGPDQPAHLRSLIRALAVR